RHCGAPAPPERQCRRAGIAGASAPIVDSYRPRLQASHTSAKSRSSACSHYLDKLEIGEIGRCGGTVPGNGGLGTVPPMMAHFLHEGAINLVAAQPSPGKASGAR